MEKFFLHVCQLRRCNINKLEQEKRKMRKKKNSLSNISRFFTHWQWNETRKKDGIKRKQREKKGNFHKINTWILLLYVFSSFWLYTRRIDGSFVLFSKYYSYYLTFLLIFSSKMPQNNDIRKLLEQKERKFWIMFSWAWFS